MMVAGSTVAVTRSLLPLVPTSSQYNRMYKSAKENEALLRSQRLLLPSFYNIGHVEASNIDDSYSLDTGPRGTSEKTLSGSGFGSKGSGSAAAGSNGGYSGVHSLFMK